MRRLDASAMSPWQARACHGALVLLLVLAGKQTLAMLEPSQLQWLLWPLAQLLNLFGGFAFAPLASGEWLDAERGLVIVKACAGGNFLVASWLGYLWRWRGRDFGAALLAQALVFAWLTTIAANALRIVCIAHGQDALADLAGISHEDSHRLIGVVVYFGCLALQMGGLGALPAAVAVYLVVTVGLPVARAWLLRIEAPEATHLAWTASVPLGVWALSALWAGLWSRWTWDGRPLSYVGAAKSRPAGRARLQRSVSADSMAAEVNDTWDACGCRRR